MTAVYLSLAGEPWDAVARNCRADGRADIEVLCWPPLELTGVAQDETGATPGTWSNGGEGA